MDLQAIQSVLRKFDLDGYLLYDFHGRDVLAYRILDLGNPHYTRRWFYFIPANGVAQKIVSSVEPQVLDSVPGEKHVVLKWQDLHVKLKEILAGHQNVAMHYSPMGDVPYVSIVDGGTIDLIRSFGIEVVSAQELIQEFEGLVTEEMFESHKKASPIMHQITNDAFNEIGKRITANEKVTEYDIHKFMQKKYRENGLVTDMSPIVGINEHAADPHYIGGLIGVLCVLHTWSSSLVYHPHAHCLIPAGGISADKQQWLPARNNYLVPVKALSKGS